MAGINIKNIPNATSLTTEDYVIVEQTAGTKKTSINELTKTGTVVHYSDTADTIAIQKPDIIEKVNETSTNLKIVEEDTNKNKQLLNNRVSPINFGCIGDGQTDDTINFQKACDSLKNGDILLIDGKFLISSQINIPVECQLIGNGWENSQIIFSPKTQSQEDICIQFSDGTSKNIHLSNFKLISLLGKKSTTNQIGIRLGQTTSQGNHKFDNLYVEGFSKYGIMINDNFCIQFNNCYFKENGRDLFQSGAIYNYRKVWNFSGGITTGLEINNCRFAANSHGLIGESQSNHNLIKQSFFEWNQIGVYLPSTKNTVLQTCFFEDNYILGAYLNRASQIDCYSQSVNDKVDIATESNIKMTAIVNKYDNKEALNIYGGNISSFIGDMNEIGFTAEKDPVPTWKTNQNIKEGLYCINNYNIYQAVTSGKTGSIAPTHLEGIVSDGAVEWNFIKSLELIDFVTGMEVVKNQLIVSGTKVYKCLKSGALGTSSPSHTSGLVLSNGIPLEYMGLLQNYTSMNLGLKIEPSKGIYGRVLNIRDNIFKTLCKISGKGSYWSNNLYSDNTDVASIEMQGAYVGGSKGVTGRIAFRTGFNNADGSSYKIEDNFFMNNDGTIECVKNGGAIILKSPDGTRYKLSIANGGSLNIAQL